MNMRHARIQKCIADALEMHRVGAVPEMSGWQLIVASVRNEVADATNDEIVDCVESLVRGAVADGDDEAAETWAELFGGPSQLQ